MLNKKDNEIQKETISAIFIIAFVSLFIAANFIAGFNLVVFVLAMGVAAAIAFFYPRSGIYAIVFLTFIFERFFTLQSMTFGRSELKLYPLDVILVAIFASVILQLLARKTKFDFFKKDALLLAFIILAIVYFIAGIILTKNDFALAFSSFKNYTFYPAVYFLIIALFKKRLYVEQLFKFALAGAIGIIGFIIFGILSGGGLWTEFTPLTTSGVRILAATHAFYLSFSVLATVSFIIFKRKETAKGFALLVAVWAIGIAGSLMRNIWLGMALALCSMYFVIGVEQRVVLKSYLRKYLVVIIAIAATILFLAMLFPRSALNESSQAVTGAILERATAISSEDDSINWRYVVWKSTFDEFSINPFVGLGFGRMIFIEIEKYDFKNMVEVRDIHNSIFAILFQMGVVSFAVFIGFIYMHLRSLWEYVKRETDWIATFMLAAIIFILVISQFQPYLEANMTSICIWIIFGLSAAILRIKKSK